jgi:hypothetical protein
VSDLLSVAILVNDEVVATSSDPAAVSVAAALVASGITETRPALWPVAEGRREACHRIAMRTVPTDEVA